MSWWSAATTPSATSAARRPAPGRWSSWGPGCLRWRAVHHLHHDRPARQRRIRRQRGGRPADRAVHRPEAGLVAVVAGAPAPQLRRATGVTATRAGRSTPIRSIVPTRADADFDFGRARTADLSGPAPAHSALRPARAITSPTIAPASLPSAAVTSRWVTARTIRGPRADTVTFCFAACRRHGRGRVRPGVDDHDVGLHARRVHRRRGPLRHRRRERAGPGMIIGQPDQLMIERVAGRRRPACRPGANRRRVACGAPGPGRFSAVLTSIEPTGAPRPLEKQTLTVSNSEP